jgi:hypothetical protein
MTSRTASRLINWLRAPFAWTIYRDTGVWRYLENSVTGQRMAVKTCRAGQPLMLDWLRDGDKVIDQSGRVIIGSREWKGQW